MASRSPELVRLPLLKATGLTIRIGEQVLLDAADFEVRRGERVLLVGPSGTGKTVLLKVIAGILRPGHHGLLVSGELTLDGVSLLRRPAEPGRIGILFQDHALFDELTPRENVLFALRHRRRQPRASARSAGQHADRLLEQLHIPRNASLRTLSGGQLQRTALARSLALDPELLLYDEPTTGLDPATGQRVAELIRRNHDERQCTALIVTHDTRLLAGLADRMLFLDPLAAKLTEVPAGELDARFAGAVTRPLPPERRGVPARPGRGLLEGTADVLLAALAGVVHLVPLYPRWHYGGRYLRHALGLTASAGSFAYVGLAGVILGFVATYFTFEHLPKRGFTEPLFVDDILRALGYLFYRVLVPVLLTVLLAARTGAALASDIGNKVYARQFDAFRSFGVAPSRYLLTSSLWAMLLGMPLLLGLMFLAARSVSLGVFIFSHPDQTYFFWDQNFHRSLRLPDEFLWRGSGWLLLKVELCAFGTATIAYFQGARNKESAIELSRAVTRTIIASTLLVLVVHFVLAFLEF